MHTLSENTNTLQPAEVFEAQLITDITDLRVQLGWSQSELARRSGVPQKTISRMENGLSFPALKTLYTLIEAMGHTLTFSINK